MRRRRWGSQVSRAVLVAVLIVIILFLGWLGPLRSLFSTIGAPFAGALSGVGQRVGGAFALVGGIGDLQTNNQKLRIENADLRQRLSDDAELRAQNESLRKQLNFTAIEPRQLIAGQVIGYQPDNFRQYITISRGSRDGVEEGMAVISEGSLVGTISEVTPATSKVFLVSDPSFRIAGIDQDRPTRPSGTVRGQIGGGLIMEKIAQNETVGTGDTIVTGGLSGLVPKGIVIGRIAATETTDNAVFQTAQLTSALTFSRLELVYVVARP